MTVKELVDVIGGYRGILLVENGNWDNVYLTTTTRKDSMPEEWANKKVIEMRPADSEVITVIFVK